MLAIPAKMFLENRTSKLKSFNISFNAWLIIALLCVYNSYIL